VESLVDRELEVPSLEDQFHGGNARLMAQFLVAGAMHVASRPVHTATGIAAVQAVHEVCERFITGLRKPT
jgi:hypothetical protein